MAMKCRETNYAKQFADLFIQKCIAYDKTKNEVYNPSLTLYAVLRMYGYSKKSFRKWLNHYFPTISYNDAVLMMDEWLCSMNLERDNHNEW